MGLNKEKYVSIYHEIGFGELKFKRKVKRKNIKEALAHYRKKGYDVKPKKKDKKGIYVIF